MEKQKNYVQHIIKNNDILPIEEEMLDAVKMHIENKIGNKIDRLEKYSTEPQFDYYYAVCGKTPLGIKINLSPDTPNFWEELSLNNFSFHPKILCSCLGSEDYKFFCFEMPTGIFLSDVSNYPLSPKLNLINLFAKNVKKIHQSKISGFDKTIDIFDAFLPIEASMISATFPLAQLIGTCKSLFKSIYKSNLNDCGLCHFDLCPENIILSNKEFKFINFEYAGNANIYIDLWLAKETMNTSEQAFVSFLDSYSLDKTKLHSYKDASDFFIFAYFNSKIIAEYMTFGVRNPIKLKYWINKSSEFYGRIAHKLFVGKTLDKNIREFYNLWKY